VARGVPRSFCYCGSRHFQMKLSSQVFPGPDGARRATTSVRRTQTRAAWRAFLCSSQQQKSGGKYPSLPADRGRGQPEDTTSH
jgi:hypothetical protein